MNQEAMPIFEPVVMEVVRVSSSIIRQKSTERDCPRCDAVLVLNDPEQCYECDKCGYIDCGGSV